jgi:hypothetical protein
MPELYCDNHALMPAGRECGVGKGDMDTLAGVEINLREHYLGKPERQTGQWIRALPAIDCRAAR